MSGFVGGAEVLLDATGALGDTNWIGRMIVSTIADGAPMIFARINAGLAAIGVDDGVNVVVGLATNCTTCSNGNKLPSTVPSGRMA